MKEHNGIKYNELTEKECLEYVKNMKAHDEADFQKLIDVSLNLYYHFIKQKEEDTQLKATYLRAATHLINIGKDELGNHLLAQIGAVPTWTTFEDYKSFVYKDTIRDLIKEYKDYIQALHPASDAMLIETYEDYIKAWKKLLEEDDKKYIHFEDLK